MNFVIILVIAGATRMLEKRFKGKFESLSRKIFNRYNTKDSYTWNIAQNTGSIAV